MKFLHLADLHLGRSLGDFDLKEDQQYILDRILQIAKEKEVDAVLIAGDVYDRAIPSEAAVNLFDGLLKDLAEMEISVFIISGNHDSDDRLHFGSDLFAAKGIHIAACYDGSMYRKTLTDSYGELDVWLLPFVKASRVKHFHPEAEISTYEDAVRTILAESGFDPERRNLLLAHQFVAGRNGDPLLSGSEGLAVQSVGLVEKIGYDCFAGFDYVALGHIHSPQRVGREEVRYAGSPLKYSLSEVNNEKSVPVVTLTEKGQVSVELVPLQPQRDLRHLRGKLRELLDPERVCDNRDFIYVTLTDAEPINDVMSILQQTYPNTVRVEYAGRYGAEAEGIELSEAAEQKSFEELIPEFYRMVYGEEISEEELAVMKKIAGEAGVIHEAD